MSVAVMQPYLLPYIGYFQLIRSVNHFVFYDDVNYIKRGWINRNYFLINKQKQLITLPCSKSSQNKLINEIDLSFDSKVIQKILDSLSYSYKKAPFFNRVMTLMEQLMNFKDHNLARFTANSIIKVCQYLEIKNDFSFSSVLFPETKGMDKADRLIEITKKLGDKRYINPSGGIELYSKKYFSLHGIELMFHKSRDIHYQQFDNDFVPWLSILDVLMFNDIAKVHTLLDLYYLI